MSSEEFDTTLSQLDRLIQNGQHGQARELLVNTNLSQLPRKYIFPFADVARRVNTPKMIVKLLRPLILNDSPTESPATNQEKALYATGLSRLGSFAEAQALLKTLESETAPEVLLFQAQNFMLQWDDLSAIPKLNKLITHRMASPYQIFVAKINLAACYIAEMNWKEGDSILQETRQEIESSARNKNKSENDLESFRLLYANSLELSAQSSLQQTEYTKALEFISRGEKFLLGTSSRYEMLLKKWNSIVKLMQSPNNSSALEDFLHLKNESFKARNWETLRDLEFYQALALRDDGLFIKLYHGTPYSSFRKRIKHLYAPTFIIPNSLVWDVNFLAPTETRFKTFDLSKGCETDGANAMTDTPLLFNLLKILTKDFYRPVHIGSLIALLYEGEHYNPISSPEKALQAIKRLRKWFTDHDVPLDIEASETTFKLVANSKYGLRLSYRQQPLTKHTSTLERLVNHFIDQAFSAKEVSEQLEISLSHSRQFLKWAVEQKKIKAIALGRSARYRLK
jgi:hypothetical protein